jgi:hypothetical protein
MRFPVATAFARQLSPYFASEKSPISLPSSLSIGASDPAFAARIFPERSVRANPPLGSI